MGYLVVYVIPSLAAIFVRIFPYFLNSFLRYKISPNTGNVSERNVRWALALREEEKRTFFDIGLSQ